MDTRSYLGKIQANLFLIPPERFDALCRDPDHRPSFLHLLLCMVLAIPIKVLTNLMIGNPLGPLLSIPFAFTVGIALTYAIYMLQHLLLRLMGGKASFLQSAQIFIYGGTCQLVLGGIPVVGIIPAIIALVNVVRGASRVHGISLLRSALALILIPLLLLGLLFASLMLMLGGAILAGGAAMLLPGIGT